MLSKLRCTIIGLVFTGIFYLTFPVAYMFLIFTLMYGDENTIRAFANFALFLLTGFLVLSALLLRKFLNHLKSGKELSTSSISRYFLGLVVISYMIVVYSPFIQYHYFRAEGQLMERMIINSLWGLVFVVLGIVMNIMEHSHERRLRG